MTSRFVSFLGSIRTSITLILSLSAIFLMGLWIPQKGLLQRIQYLQWKDSSPKLVSFLEALGLTDIYTSPLTLTLWALFFVNLSLVMWKRVKIVRSLLSFSTRKVEDPLTSAGYMQKASVRLRNSVTRDQLSSIFRGERYRFFGDPERFYAVRNRLAPCATLLFHLSFFLMLFGGVVSIYTKFEGTADLAEGEEFHGELDRYNAPPRIPKIGGLPKLNVMVESIRPEMIGGKPTSISVTLRNERGQSSIVQVNSPYDANGVSLVIKDLGIAPLFIISDSGGRELDGAFIKRGTAPNIVETFHMAGLQIGARFFPDYAVRNGGEVSLSAEIKNPAFNLFVEEGLKLIGRKTVLLGQSVDIGNYRIAFPELRYAVRLYVVKEHGSGIVFTGFLIATVALIWRLIFFRREIVGSIVKGAEGPVLHLAGRAEFYKVLFEDEFQQLAQRIGSGLQ